jgi:hypothetical protein
MGLASLVVAMGCHLKEGRSPARVGYDYGPYTVEDLHGLPDNGRSHELVDGWLIELAPSTRHDFLAGRLSRILERAAEAAKARVYVQAPMDISTPAGARKPDVGVIHATAVSSARWLGRSVCHVGGHIFVAGGSSPYPSPHKVARRRT